MKFEERLNFLHSLNTSFRNSAMTSEKALKEKDQELEIVYQKKEFVEEQLKKEKAARYTLQQEKIKYEEQLRIKQEELDGKNIQI